MRHEMIVQQVQTFDAALETAVRDYYRGMQAIDPGFFWKNPHWWQDLINAKVFVARTDELILGFLIVGYGSNVDADVRSEVCEVFSCGGLPILTALFRAAHPALTPPWGFQVLQHNVRARRLFDWLLTRHGFAWSATAASEDGLQVVKYRIATQP